MMPSIRRLALLAVAAISASSTSACSPETATAVSADAAADVTPTDAQKSCAPGEMSCGGQCKNPESDNANCGVCGHACPSGQVCSAGKCSTTCISGELLCNGQCVEPASDNANCGTCNNGCPSGEACSGGKCATTCVSGEVLCNGFCIDPLTSNLYCGASSGCGAGGGSAGVSCGSAEGCVDGTCGCGSSSCAGCCSSGTCLTLVVETNAECGSGGAACQACGGLTPTCTGGSCAGACGGSNDGACATGCCGGGECQSGTSATACGSGGACVDCTTSSAGTACLSGTCGCDGNGECASGQRCATSSCTCDTSSCAGCCVGTLCQPCGGTCGNGVLEGNEQCDDGNLWDLDGCDSHCRYEMVVRLTSLAVSGAPAPASLGCGPNTNALGTQVVTSVGLSQLNAALQSAIDAGTSNTLLQARNLTDLTGSSATGFDLGVVNGYLDPARGTYPGNAPIDWWFLADPSGLSSGLPTSLFTGAALANHSLAAGPSNVPIDIPLWGSSSSVQLLAAHLRGTVTVPPVPDIPAPPPAQLATGLTVFQQLAGNGAGQGLCANITVQSLAQVPVPPTFVQGATACEACVGSNQYTSCGSGPVGPNCNSLLDVLVGGCRVGSGCLVAVAAINPTQPDVPYSASVTPLVSSGSLNKVTPPANDLDAYSAYFTFAANRAHLTGQTCTSSTQCQTGMACIADRCVLGHGGLDGGSDASAGPDASNDTGAHGCTASSQCAGGLVCVSGQCTSVVLLLATSPTSNMFGGALVPGSSWVSASLADSSSFAPSLTMDSAGRGVGAYVSTTGAVVSSTVWSNGTWGAPAAINAVAIARGQPSIDATGGTTSHLVYQDATYKYWHLAFTGTWSSQQAIGVAGNQYYGPLTATVAALGPNATAAFFDGQAGADVNYAATSDLVGGSWQAKVDVAGNTIGGNSSGYVIPPAVIALSAGPELLMAYVDASNGIEFVTRTSGVWSSPQAISNALTNDPIALAPLPGGGAILAFRGQDSNLYWSEYRSSAWSAVTALSSPNVAIAMAPAVTHGVAGDVAEIAFVEGDGRAYAARLSGGMWSAPTLVGGASLAGVSIAAAP